MTSSSSLISLSSITKDVQEESANDVVNQSDEKAEEKVEKSSEVVEKSESEKIKHIKSNDVFVGNLSLYTNNEKLKEYFIRFGYVEDVRIMYHPETKRSRRFGFVTFANESSVELVINFSNHQLDGKVLDVKHAFKRSDEEGGVGPVVRSHQEKRPVSVLIGPVKSSSSVGGQNNNNSSSMSKIFVGGVSQDANTADVKEYFSKFGPVTSCILLPDLSTGRHRGFGFVSFASDRMADVVCATPFHFIKNKKAEVKRAMPKPPGHDLNANKLMAATAAVPPVRSIFGDYNQPLGNILALPSTHDSQLTLWQQHAQQAQQQQQPVLSSTSGKSRFSPYAVPSVGTASTVYQQPPSHHHEQLHAAPTVPMYTTHLDQSLYPLQALLQAAQASYPMLSAMMLQQQQDYRQQPTLMYSSSTPFNTGGQERADSTVVGKANSTLYPPM